MPTPADAVVERRAIRVRGAVQGVGFRPFVYRLAHELGLAGWVLQRRAGRGDRGPGAGAALARIRARACATEAPPLARVEQLEVERRCRLPTACRAFASWPAGAGPVTTAIAPRHRDLRRLPGRAVRPGRPAPSLCLHQLHPLRPALHAHARACPTTARTPAWRRSRCARAACASTPIRGTAASMPSRTPARRAGRAALRRCARRADRGRSDRRHARAAARRRRSSPSRAWAAFTSPATRATPAAVARCASASSARTSRSR